MLSQVANKADKSALDVKADKSELEAELARKADKSEVDDKADKSEVKKTNNFLVHALANKADKSALDVKADKSHVNLRCHELHNRSDNISARLDSTIQDND